MIRWAVFVSGTGSNLQNVLEQESRWKRQVVCLVLADRPCLAIERAKSFGKKNYVIEGTKESFEKQALLKLKEEKIDAILLLGFMKILSSSFIERWGRVVVNLHPSALPAHRGKEAIRRAWEAGDPYFGVTLHHVVAEVDAGPWIRQATLPRQPNWTLEEAMKHVHQLEHELVRDFLLDVDEGKILNDGNGQ